MKNQFEIIGLDFAKLDKPNFEVKRFPLCVKTEGVDKKRLVRAMSCLRKDPMDDRDHQTAFTTLAKDLFGFGSGEPVEPEGGWGADRYWFSMKVRDRRPWGVDAIYTGYTSEVDFSTKELDPKLTLHFNTVQKTMEHQGVVATNQWTELHSEGPTFNPDVDERYTSLAPADLTGTVEVLYSFPGETLIDARALINGRRVFSRNDATLSGYLKNLLEGISASGVLETEDPDYDLIAGAFNKGHVSFDPFGHWLENNTPFAEREISLWELVEAMPEINGKIRVFESSVSETQVPEDNYNVQQRADDLQPFIQEVVTGLMGVGAYQGQLTMSTHLNGDLKQVEVFSGDSPEVILDEEHSWESYVQEVVIPRSMAAYPKGYEGAKVDIHYTRVNTTRVTITTPDGKTVLKFPTFADHLTTPLLTRHYKNLYSEAEKLYTALIQPITKR